jgi:hypothetical protein
MGIDTTASLRMFVVTYNTKYETYIVSKSSTVSLDVLNALSHKRNVEPSVKGLRTKFTFHSIVTFAKNCGSLCYSVTTRSSSLYQFKAKRFLDPNQSCGLGIVQMEQLK